MATDNVALSRRQLKQVPRQASDSSGFLESCLEHYHMVGHLFEFQSQFTANKNLGRQQTEWKNTTFTNGEC